jgi:hypothetical protein
VALAGLTVAVRTNGVLEPAVIEVEEREISVVVVAQQVRTRYATLEVELT